MTVEILDRSDVQQIVKDMLYEYGIKPNEFGDDNIQKKKQRRKKTHHMWTPTEDEWLAENRDWITADICVKKFGVTKSAAYSRIVYIKRLFDERKDDNERETQESIPGV